MFLSMLKCFPCRKYMKQMLILNVCVCVDAFKRNGHLERIDELEVILATLLSHQTNERIQPICHRIPILKDKKAQFIAMGLCIFLPCMPAHAHYTQCHVWIAIVFLHLLPRHWWFPFPRRMKSLYAWNIDIFLGTYISYRSDLDLMNRNNGMIFQCHATTRSRGEAEFLIFFSCFVIVWDESVNSFPYWSLLNNYFDLLALFWVLIYSRFAFAVHLCRLF